MSIARIKGWIYIELVDTKTNDEYHDLEARAEELDQDELKAARLSLRPEEEKRAVSKLEDAYGNNYDPSVMREAKEQVSDLLRENYSDSRPRSVRQDLQQKQKDVQQRELPQRNSHGIWRGNAFSSYSSSLRFISIQTPKSPQSLFRRR